MSEFPLSAIPFPKFSAFGVAIQTDPSSFSQTFRNPHLLYTLYPSIIFFTSHNSIKSAS